jgi:hypothetical protein
MDRAAIERLIASAARPELHELYLPALDQTVHLRRPTREQAFRVVTAAGQDEDWQARALTGALRFALVDDAGRELIRTFEEAGAFLNALDNDDLVLLMPKLDELLGSAAEVLDGEAGKAL